MYFGDLNFVGGEDITGQLNDFIGDKEIIIIENDTSLCDEIKNFYQWCVENRKQVNILYSAYMLPVEYFKEVICGNMVIVFMTTGKNETVKKLLPYIETLKNNNIKVIETYANVKRRF